MSIASIDRKIFELITKLIYDTARNRIIWSGGIVNGTGEFHAEYDNFYRLVFYVEFTRVMSYKLSLFDRNGTYFPVIVNINSLSDLYDAILKQTGFGSKMYAAIEHILNLK